MSVGSARGARLKHAPDFSGSLLRSAATGLRGLCCQSERAVQFCICEKRWRDLRLEAKTETLVFSSSGVLGSYGALALREGLQKALRASLQSELAV